MENVWNGSPLETVQSEDDNFFIGGIPKLPHGTTIPVCTLCNQDMTFMFQIAFPKEHVWSGKTLALFFCLDCYSDKYCIPEMPKGSSLFQVEIPDDFLDSYQRNFKILIFDSNDGVLQKDYTARIPFLKLEMQPGQYNDENADFTLEGGLYDRKQQTKEKVFSI